MAKKIKIFAVIIAIILTIIGIALLMNNGETIAVEGFPYVQGSTYRIERLLDNPQLYCLNHGRDFYFGDYECYEVKEGDAILAYLVAHQTNNNRDQNTDPIANAIWRYMGSPVTPGMEETADKLIEEARTATSAISASGNNIQLTGPQNNPVVEDASGRVGPYKITYPTVNGKMVGTVTIKVNGQTLSKIPESGKEFYLTKEDGIKYGQKNDITVTYDGETYTCTYAKFTPLAAATGTAQATCMGCGVTGTATAHGIKKNNGTVIPDGKGWVMNESVTHQPDCENPTMMLNPVSALWRYDERPSPHHSDYNSKDLQDLIFIAPEKKPIHEEKSLDFWAGKPELKIDLNKENTMGKPLSEVQFKVTVEGGKIGDSTTSEPQTVGGRSNFTIKPDVGAEHITVTLEEISTPEDYIKLDSPIVIKYDWTGDRWQGWLEQGIKGEKIEVTSSMGERKSTICMDTSVLKIINRPVIKVTLDKRDPQGQVVENVEFEIDVTGGTAEESIIKHGETVIIKPDAGVETVTVTLTEQDPGEEFVKYKEPIVMTFEFNGESWNLVKSSKPEDPEKVELNTTTSNDTGVVEVKINAVNRRQIIVDFTKEDNGGNKIEMTFDVTVSGGTFDNESTSKTITTNTSNAEELIIIPNGTNDVTLTFVEKPDVYYKDLGTIEITFSYSGGEWQAVRTPDCAEIGKTTNDEGIIVFELTIENTAIIQEVTVTKINTSYNDERISGITFNVELVNAKDSSGKTYLTHVTTDSNGQLNLGTLEVTNPNDPISIILEEVGVPNGLNLNYKGLYPNGKVTITFNHKGSGCTVSNPSVASATYNNDNEVEITIENEVTLDLSGRVWKDGQTGLKPVQSPNNLDNNGEPGIPGVKVLLKGYEERETTTDSNGGYSFKDLPASVNGSTNYYIEFVYDGIHYQAVTPHVGNDTTIDSDANEVDRTGFNNKFRTITRNTATGTTGATTALQYDVNGNDAILKTTDANGVVLADFAMTATTQPDTYNEITADIDMGLVKRGLNLSAVTELEQAVVTINGKSATYPYNELRGLQQDENGNLIFNGEDIKNNLLQRNLQYNLYLYASDYNYRMHDYSQVQAYDNANVGRPGMASGEEIKNSQDEELDVTLTYQIALNNHSATTSTVNEIAYYYDSSLEIPNNSYNVTQVNMDGKTYNKIIIPVKATLDGQINQSLFNITFKVKKTNNAIDIGTVKTWVEIISYSSTEGCIDDNSAPDNIIEHNTEDDSDDARGLNIAIQNDSRTISGYVFEDSKQSNGTGNGQYNSGETKVDGVIVQLIEIKELESLGIKLEYIWQETVSGSSAVKVLSLDGKSVTTQSVQKEEGRYTFTGFIPGDYIVRFIYGDGTYFDLDIDGTQAPQQSILQYNGQDYKSTIDVGYDYRRFDKNTYSGEASMARDNEARRLRQMAWATETNGNSDLNINTKDKLKDSWMCAETSKVQIPITENAEDVAAGTATGNNTEERKLNFGLVERPNAQLILEKHITSLKVTSTDNRTIVDVTTGEPYADANGKVYNQDNGGLTKVLTPTATDKDITNSIGQWNISYDVSQYGDIIVQIGYTYNISNVGDKDYIGQELNALIGNNKLSDVYTQVASQLENNNRLVMANEGIINAVIGTYLGKVYYTGSNQGNSDVEIGIPLKLEDYLLADKQYSNNINFAEKNINPNSITPTEKVYWKDSTNIQKVNVKVLNSDEFELRGGESRTYKLNTVQQVDPTITSNCIFNSSTAQLAFGETLTSKTGRVAQDANRNNVLSTLATASDGTAGGVTVGEASVVYTTDIAPQSDEFIAETVQIIPTFGADKETPVILIASVTAGLVVVAVGIVLIKKFIIK